MKTKIATLLSLLISISMPSGAQEVELDKAAHAMAIAKVSGLMYVRTMSQKCPFEKKMAESFEFVALIMSAGIPKLPQEEVQNISKTAETRAENDLKNSRDESCKKAILAVQATIDEVENLLNPKK